LSGFLTDGDAFLRVARGRFHEIRESFGAEAFVQGKISVRRAGDRDTSPAGLRHVLPTCFAQCLSRHRLATPSAGIQPIQLSPPENHDEGVPAQAVHHRLGHVGRGRHRDCGVNRVSTLLEDLETHLRSQRLA
jgi:hypothetical protein